MKVQDVISKLERPKGEPIPAPPYNGTSSKGIMLAVESMRRHMTDEGWQIAAALESAGYKLCGNALPIGDWVSTDVYKILEHTNPGIVVVQDKREWDTVPGDFRDHYARFRNVEALANRPDIFRVTILKDAHQRPEYHREAAIEMGAHAWIVYYNPQIVCYLAPYVRPEHVIRTYHTLDPQLVPKFNENRRGCLLSGAVSRAYPLRLRLVDNVAWLPETTYLKHPGYHRNGCQTANFLQALNQYKVAICTASMYGYALRKIVEATACGCAVVTDLPEDEILPGGIDGNLVRVEPNITTHEVSALLRKLYREYDVESQKEFAKRATDVYDYRTIGVWLRAGILSQVLNYKSTKRAREHERTASTR